MLHTLIATNGRSVHALSIAQHYANSDYTVIYIKVLIESRRENNQETGQNEVRSHSKWRRKSVRRPLISPSETKEADQ